VLSRDAPSFSDKHLALRLAERHEVHLRFEAGWNKWLTFDGTRWQFDKTLLAFDPARAICREAAQPCNDLKNASATAFAKTLAGADRLAKKGSQRFSDVIVL
jgi:putative DNA primase/helicase